jgi:hypothetical protein
LFFISRRMAALLFIQLILYKRGALPSSLVIGAEWRNSDSRPKSSHQRVSVFAKKEYRVFKSERDRGPPPPYLEVSLLFGAFTWWVRTCQELSVSLYGNHANSFSHVNLTFSSFPDLLPFFLILLSYFILYVIPDQVNYLLISSLLILHL